MSKKSIFYILQVFSRLRLDDFFLLQSGLQFHTSLPLFSSFTLNLLSSLLLHLTSFKVSFCIPSYNFPPFCSLLSVRADCAFGSRLMTISTEHNIKPSMSWKERGATEEEWECALTIHCFIKMSNTKGYRKKGYYWYQKHISQKQISWSGRRMSVALHLF